MPARSGGWLPGAPPPEGMGVMRVVEVKGCPQCDLHKVGVPNARQVRVTGAQQ